MAEVKDQEEQETRVEETKIKEEKTLVKKPDKKRLGGLVKLLDKAIKVIIYATIFLTPLIFSPFTFDTLELPKQSFLGIMVSVGLILWLLKMVLQKSFSLRRTPLDIPILVFVGVYLISSLVSISPLVSLLGFYGRLSSSFISTIYLVVLYYLTVNNMKTDKEISGVFLSLFMSAILVALIGILQIFGIYILPSSVTQIKTFNTVGTLNAMAVFLMGVVPLGLAQSLFKKSESRISFTVSTVFMFILLILLNIQAAWLGLLAATIGIGALAIYKKSKDMNWSLLAIPGVLALLSIVFVFYSSFGVNLPKEVTLSKDRAVSQVQKVVKEKPIFGSGPETYVFNFSKHRTADMNKAPEWSLRFDKAGGEWLTILATTGILGLLSFGFVVVMALVLGIKQSINSSDTSKYLSMGLTGTVLAISVYGLFYYTNSSLSLVLWVSLALISLLSLRNKKDEAPKEIGVTSGSLEVKVFSSVFLVLLLLGSFYSIYYSTQAYGADVKYREGLELALTDEDLSKSEKALKEAIEKNGQRENYRLSLARLLLIEANIESQKENQDDVDTEKIQSLLARAIDEGKLAVNLNPMSVANWESMAVIYRNASLYATGAIDWIKATYSEAINLEPTNPILVNGLGQAYLTNKETDRAKELFSEAIALKDNFADPYFNLALAHKDAKEYDAAIAQFNKFLELVPDNEDAIKQIQEVEDIKSGKIVLDENDGSLQGRPPATEVEKESVGTNVNESVDEDEDTTDEDEE